MIRIMKTTDLESVADLEVRCFSEPWSYRILASGIHSNYDTYYVFEQDTAVIGYANLRILAGEAEVQRIAVHPAWQGLGVGRKLMDAMVTNATIQRVSAIRLEVRGSNIAARSLYESYGFVTEAIRKAYYHNPIEDAYMMCRQML